MVKQFNLIPGAVQGVKMIGDGDIATINELLKDHFIHELSFCGSTVRIDLEKYVKIKKLKRQVKELEELVFDMQSQINDNDDDVKRLWNKLSVHDKQFQWLQKGNDTLNNVNIQTQENEKQIKQLWGVVQGMIKADTQAKVSDWKKKWDRSLEDPFSLIGRQVVWNGHAGEIIEVRSTDPKEINYLLFGSDLNETWLERSDFQLVEPDDTHAATMSPRL